MSTQKEISWSYPTSTNAHRLGFGKTGCWTVSLTDGKLVSGHRKATDAVNAADALPHDYSRHSFQFVRDHFDGVRLCDASIEHIATA